MLQVDKNYVKLTAPNGTKNILKLIKPKLFKIKENFFNDYYKTGSLIVY